jgi:pimeloyl-ACP methyl ester carboxylesterase
VYIRSIRLSLDHETYRDNTMAHAGTVHKYSKKLVAFEHSSASPSNANDAPNTLLWIGGLGDGLLTVAYPTTIASSLPSNWVLAEVVLRSSYNGWATGRLSRDAREIGECVTYFRNLRPGKKVVLMGHSTGCQDIMEYLVGPDAKNQPPIDGAILQGGVSDREAWEHMTKTDEEKRSFQEIVDKAKEMIDNGDERAILPVKGNMVAQELGAPITAYRTYSLLFKGGDDDYFSSDLSDEHFQSTFGKIPHTSRLCFLLGSEDPYVPTKINKSDLLQRWTRIIRQGGGAVDDVNGGVVEGAHHNLNGDPEEVVKDLVKRVVGFVEGLQEHSESGKADSRL